MLLFYIRHGDPVYDPDSLTPLGEAQAAAVAKRLLLYGVDSIYASTSNRARLTARPLCELTGLEMQLCDWANESHAWAEFAVATEKGGRTWSFNKKELARIFTCPEVRNMGENWYEHPKLIQYGFGKGVARINSAADEFFSSLGYEHDRENGGYRAVSPNEKRVALFAHQGFGICFLSSLLDIPYPMFSTRFDFGHSSMTVIRFPEKGDFVYPKVLQLSNDSHLYREGILTGYNNVYRF